MNITMLLLLSLLAVMAVGLLLLRRRRRPDGLERFFEAAVRVAVWRDDAAALLAALAAVKMATPAQRVAMMTHLAQLSGRLQRVATRASKGDDVYARLQEVAAKLTDDGWRQADAADAEQALAAVDGELLEALQRGDPEVFHRRHRRLFEAGSLLDLVVLDKADTRSGLARMMGRE